MEKLYYLMKKDEIVTDFVISGYDWHLNHFGFIRDADTLQIIPSSL